MPKVRRLRNRSAATLSQQMLRTAGFSIALALAVWALLSVNVLPRSYEAREGDVSQTNIRSPRKLTYTSQVRTKAERDRTAGAVPEVVEIDPSLVQRQRSGLNSLLQGISAARNGPNLNPDQRRAQVMTIGQPPFEDPYATWLIALDDPRWYLVSSESQRLLWDVMKDRVPEWRVAEIVRELPLRASDQLTESERLLAIELAGRFVASNLVPNRDQTTRLRREASEAVAPVQITVERGEVVLREGQVIGPADLEKLEVLGLRDPATDWRQIGAAGGFAVLAIGMLGVYILVFQPTLLERDKGLGLIACLVIVTVLAAKVVLPERPLWVYVFPLPAVAMVATTLLDGRLAIVLSTVLAILVAFVAGTSLEVACIGIVTGLVAAAAVWKRERFLNFFIAGILVAVAEIVVVLAFQLAQRGEDWQTLLIVAAECLINGLLSATLAVGTLSLLGRIFGITTTMQLLELANPTQPLLRRLLMEAPGTYHHSIMVGNLAERAAEEVGADTLLVRVGAYYHDIGKLRRPYFFVENQAGGENVHETLEPEVSADIVRAHVKDGVELCEHYGVPQIVRDIIPQHHGSRLVSFFYDQAVDAATSTGQETPDPRRFRYPGPRPYTKEGAIIMLADSVEAAARASKDHSVEAITNLVDKLIMQRVNEGQLDDCELTLRDIQRIKDAFRVILAGMYHPRIEYPERAKPALVTPAARELPASVADATR